MHHILAYMAKPSHAYTVATPAHRLVVESEHFHPQGHEVVESIRHRKFTGSFGTMTGIELMIGYEDPEKTEKYLDACQWWLHRAPFGVERLRVSVVAHGYRKFADRESKTVRRLKRFSPILCVYLSKLCTMLPEIKKLDISLTTVAELKQLEMFVAVATPIISVEPLRQLQHLSKVLLSRCKLLTSVVALEGMNTLEEVDVSYTAVSTLRALRECKTLRMVNARECESLITFGDFKGIEMLEELDVSCTDVSSVDVFVDCKKLRKLSVSYCFNLPSLSGLVHAPALEVINASGSGVADADGLSECRRLKAIDVSHCGALTSLSGLIGAPALEVILARSSGVANADGLEARPKLAVLDLRSTQCDHLSRGV